MKNLSKHHELVISLVDQIEVSLAEDVQVLEIANRFELSPWHFQRLFKSLVGDSIGNYTRGRRLSKAVELLLKSDDSVVDIAFQVGFNSHESFSRAFKLQFNLTPSELRLSNPQVVTQHKPELTSALLNFINTRIEKEPSIVEMPERTMVGFTIEIPSPFYDPVRCTIIAEPWMKLLNRISTLTEAVPNAAYGFTLSASGQFTEEKLLYLAAVELKQGELPPNDMYIHKLPAQKVALFDIIPDMTKDFLKQKIDFIYGYWLPNANCTRASGDDYEMFTDLVDISSGNFTAKYVLPVYL